VTLNLDDDRTVTLDFSRPTLALGANIVSPARRVSLAVASRDISAIAINIPMKRTRWGITFCNPTFSIMNKNDEAGCEAKKTTLPNMSDEKAIVTYHRSLYEIE